MFNWLGTERMPLVHQAALAECGLACITMVAIYHGHQIDLASMRKTFEISSRGASLSDLVDIASSLEMTARGVRCEPDDLSELKLPAILHWNFNHFVVLKSVRGGKFEIYDPAEGHRFLSGVDVSAGFTGVALEIQKMPGFKPREEKQKLKARSLIRFDSDNWKLVAKILGLSLFLQLFVLTAPLYMQFVIDEAIGNSDTSLLIAIAAGFFALKIFELFVSVVRRILLQLMGKWVSFDLRSNLFHHLIRLPVSYFQNRDSGDIQQRVNSGNAVGLFISDNLVEAIVDGLFAITIGIVIFAYNALLGGVVVGFIAFYVMVRIVLIRMTHKRQLEEQVTGAKETSYFLETLKVMPTLKILGGEKQREAKWRNLAADTINKSIRSGNVDIGYKTFNEAITSFSNTVIIFIAAYAAINGDMTIGMITAFMAYKGQFEQKLISLFDKAIEYKLLDVHLERAADIVLTDKEETQAVNPRQVFKGSIELKDVHFSYSQNDSEVIKGLNLKINPEEFVALAGGSGQGKSTLLKLIMGIHTPTSGQILYDGQSLDTWGVSNLRKQIGVVMQDDDLISGTLEENISFFDDDPDHARIEWAAHAASFLKDIREMPMGMNTLIGELGSTLSGGQKQRLMIARALYRQPRLLILDEGTSHLDLVTEAQINDELKKLNITRIFAAHRPDTLKKADRIVAIEAGAIIAQPKGQLKPISVG